MAARDEQNKSLNALEPALSKPEEGMSPEGYLRESRALLAKGRRGEAYELLRPAVVRYAEDPFLLSYFGYLTAFLDGRYRNGIESCKLAIVLFEKKLLRGEESVEERLKAVLHLNLGRAYLAGGKKKDAFDTLQKGLRFDKQNKDILEELASFGVRKYKPISFLGRSNPINALIGRMLRKNSKNATP